VAERLEAAGVDAIVLSGGFTSRAPFYLFRGPAAASRATSASPRWTGTVSAVFSIEWSDCLLHDAVASESGHFVRAVPEAGEHGVGVLAELCGRRP